MEIKEFKNKILTEQELKQFSEKEIEQLYRLSLTFADFAYKKWNEKRIKKLEVKVL